MYSSILVGFLAAGLATAGPIATRQARNDCDILNYALTLEHLEDTFYRGGVSTFKAADFAKAGFPDSFYTNLLEVASDEKTHVSFLTSAIMSACPCAVAEASYKFPYTDAKSFVTLASVFEGVGVSAYLGAAPSIATKAYLTVAGSILTVEARHSSYIRAALAERPFPEPFDTPLDFNPVFSLAAQFITSFNGDTCSAGLPFTASPPLTIQCSQYYFEEDRSSVTFSGAAKMYGDKGYGQIYAVFWSGLSKAFIPVRQTGNDFKIGPGSGASDGNAQPIPAGFTGQVYVALTKSNDANTGATSANLLTSPAVLEVWPKGQAPEGKAANCS